MSHSPQPARWLFILVMALAALVSAGPTLVKLLQAAVPLVIVGGIVAVVLRVVWHFTNRY
jgi:hypothetical protein